MQQVRQAGEKLVELRRNAREPRLAGRERVAELADLALERLDVGAGRLRAADRLRALVTGLAPALHFDLELFALGFEREIALPIELEAAAREVRGHGVEVLA